MTTETPPTLEYGTRRDRSVFVFYAVYFCMILLPAAVSAWEMLYWVPHFKDIFRDFNTTLPVMTQYLLAFSDCCQSPLVWPLGLIAVAVIPWLLAKLTVRFRVPMQRLTAAMMIMMVMMFMTLTGWMLVQVALFLPLMKLVESLSGGSR